MAHQHQTDAYPLHHLGNVWDVVCRLCAHLDGSLGPDDECDIWFFRFSRSITFTGSDHQFSRVVHAPLELMLTLNEQQLLTILFQEPFGGPRN